MAIKESKEQREYIIVQSGKFMIRYRQQLLDKFEDKLCDKKHKDNADLKRLEIKQWIHKKLRPVDKIIPGREVDYEESLAEIIEYLFSAYI